MKKTRVLLLLLSMVLVFISFTSSVMAIDRIEETEEIIILPISELPEVIDREDAIARGHVARLKNEETDMHSVIFQNNDGTKSLYMFASPVKYIDSNGNVKDKRTTLSQTASGYATADNDVQLSFGTNPTANVAYLNDSINITPVSATSVTGFSQNNTMIYNGAFGMNTMLYYTPLLSGVKSTIILRSRGDENVFSFNVDAGDLTAQKDEDGVVSLLNTDGEKLFKFGIYTVTDAVGNRIEGEMQLSANENGVYTVSAAVDTEFLNSESTVYPVAVEPTLTLNTSTAIDDAVVYSLKPNKNYGAYKYHNLGYVDNSYGIGRLLVKFPGLLNNATFNSIAYNQFRRAEFNIYTASANQQPFNMSVFRSIGTIWSESAVTWNSFHNSSPSYQSFMETDSIKTGTSAGQKETFNVLGNVKAWKLSTASLQQGLYIKADNETYDPTYPRHRDFCSTEYANANNGALMPYIEIVYDTSHYVSLNITIMFDGAFGNRAIAMYPNSATHITQRVAALMNPVVAFYQNNFGIEISYTTTLASSYIETSSCANKNNMNSTCTCFAKCATKSGNTYIHQHHTNQHLALDSISNGNPNTHINMMLYGHETCCNGDNSEYCPGDYVLLGVTSPDKYKIAIFHTATSSTSDNAAISNTIIHEIGHLYGALDHYGSHPITLPVVSRIAYGVMRMT